MDKNWQVNPFGARVILRGSKIVFVGRAGRQLMCRIRYLAKKKNKSFRQFVIDGLIRGVELCK
jgi:hypothetical protein